MGKGGGTGAKRNKRKKSVVVLHLSPPSLTLSSTPETAAPLNGVQAFVLSLVPLSLYSTTSRVAADAYDTLESAGVAARDDWS